MSRSQASTRFRWRGSGSVFVGRTEQSTRLVELCARHRVALVYGPAGIGKTELVVRALDEEVRRSRLPPAAYVSVAGATGQVDLLERTAYALRRRRPAVRGSDASGAFAEMLERCGASLVWDDVHDAPDDAVTPFVDAFLRQRGPSRLVLAGRRMIVHPAVPALELGPLAPEAARQLVRELATACGLAGGADLAVPSSGNPLLLHLAVAELQAGGSAVIADDPNVGLRRAVDRLAMDTGRRVLEVLAATELPVDASALEDACGSDVEPVLDGLRRRMLLVEDGNSVGLTAGARHVVRAAIGVETSTETWLTLVRIAERGLAGSPGGPDSLLTLARALARTGRRGEALRLLETHVAARTAAPLGALERVIRDIAGDPDAAPAALLLLGRERLRCGEFDAARAVLDEVEPLIAVPALHRRRLVLRAQAHVRAGEPGLARQDLEQALALAGGRRSPSIEIGLGELAILRGDMREACQTLVRLVPVVRDSPRLASRCATALAMAYVLEQRYDIATAWTRRARLAYRRAVSPPETVVGAIDILATIGLDRVDVVASRYARESERRERDEPLLRGIVALYPVGILWRRGEFERCMALAAPALEGLDDRADRVAKAFVASYLVRAAIGLGQFDLAAQFLHIVRAAASERGLAGLTLLCEMSSAALADARGEPEQARRFAMRAVAVSPRSPYAREEAKAFDDDEQVTFPARVAGQPCAVRAHAAMREAERCLRRGDPASAVGPARKAEEWYRQTGLRYELARCLLARGEALARMGDADAANGVLAECDALATAGGYRPISTAIALVRASLADRTGDLETYVRELVIASRRAGRDLTDESLCRACARVGLSAAVEGRREQRPFAGIVARLQLGRPATALLSVGARMFLLGPDETPPVSADLTVDLERARLVSGADTCDLARQQLLLSLLDHLVAAGREGATAEELFLRVWGGSEYHPLRRRSSIYMALTRLRRLLEAALDRREAGAVIEQTRGRYRLARGFVVAVRQQAFEGDVPAGRAGRLAVQERPEALPDAIEYARRAGLSVGQARWELALLAVERCADPSIDAA
jgi:tetratricopeptide (TPR) repeat protein